MHNIKKDQTVKSHIVSSSSTPTKFVFSWWPREKFRIWWSSRFSFPVTLFLYECMPSKVSVKISQFRKMNGNANAFVKWWLWYYMHNRNIALNIYSCLKNRAEWRLHCGNDGRWEQKSFCFLSSHNRKTYLPNFFKENYATESELLI